VRRQVADFGMMKLFVYEPETGIIKIGQTSASKKLIDRYAEGGDTAMISPRQISAHIDTVFVNRGKIQARPNLNARLSRSVIEANGRDEAIIRGVPSGAHICVSDGVDTFEHDADGGPVHIVATYPTIYRVTVEAPPHLTQTFTVKATA
jgi:hypothetical protein